MEPGQRTPTPGGRSQASIWSQETGAQDQSPQVFLRSFSGCGPPAAGSAARFLKESIPLLLDLLEASGELDDELHYSPAVRSEPGGHEHNKPSTATSPRCEPPTNCGESQQPRPVRWLSQLYQDP